LRAFLDCTKEEGGILEVAAPSLHERQ
jgi:hypothetical protein